MMDAAERALLADTVGGALADEARPADAVLADLGWIEMLEAEPRDAIAIVFDALGTTNRAATALDDVVVLALGLRPRADLAVVLPEFGAWDPPGHLAGDALGATGLATARVASASEILVVTAAPGRSVLVVAASAEVRAVHGIDPDSGFCRVQVNHRTAGAETEPSGSWEEAVALARRAVAHQLAGASRTMLALACAHAVERVQFGRPIASFQAVRHRLADALVAIEALEATLSAAGDEPNDLTAALAKATAGRTARTVAGHCQQVLAGIGFTTEHPFHRFLKRTMLLEGLFGSADDIALDLGHRLLAARRVPTLIEL